MALSRAARRAAPFPVARWSTWSGGGSAAGEAQRNLPLGLYELLGVSPAAMQAQIKMAYYKQSFLYHPDRNASSDKAAERFTRVGEAYLVLDSVTLQKKYNRGILGRQDINAARKALGKEAPSASPLPRWSQTFTARASTWPKPGKPVFDFDKFYREHFGEQLERERYQRAQLLEMKRRKKMGQWGLEATKELAAVIAFTTAVMILFSLR